MSASGRGSARDVDDFYPTPAWCVHRLLEEVPLPGGDWLEPCAGGGAVVRAVTQVRQDVRWTAAELRAEARRDLVAAGCVEVVIGSFTAMVPRRFDVVLSNPPYRAALRFVRHALEFAPVVVMLLRLNWLASQERCGWLREHAPDVYVLPNRPCFVNGRSDATDYAWMSWTREPRTSGIVRVLRSTGPGERTATSTPPSERGQLALVGCA